MASLLAINMEKTLPILIWCGVLILAVLVLFFIINAIRKAAASQADQNAAAPFTLDELRRMHRDGHLTDEEFDKARAQVIAMVRGPVEEAANAVEGDAPSETPDDSASDSPDNGGEPDRDAS